jgi:peptidyl-prolyl cis-trans isomerase C
MNVRNLVLAAAGLLLAACGGPRTMDEAIAELQARGEVSDAGIEVEHVLLAHKDGGIPGVTRTQAEAKALAESVWQRALAGEDFSKLRTELSDDKGGAPTYAMTRVTRTTYVPAFGNVGFRLQVGEIGVAPYEAKASPFGYHVIKRVR